MAFLLGLFLLICFSLLTVLDFVLSCFFEAALSLFLQSSDRWWEILTTIRGVGTKSG